VGGGDGGPLIPDDLVAFTWTIKSRNHPEFTTRKIVRRPVSPMEIAVFELPARTDVYDLTLRVSFADGSFGERKVRFDVRDWLIVSIGDSSASGQGNPDIRANVDEQAGAAVVCDNPTVSAVVGKLLDALGIADAANPPIATPAGWLEKRAWRSLRGVPATAAFSLRNDTGNTRNSRGADRTSFSFDRIRFVSFARSGAAIRDGLFDPQGGPVVETGAFGGTTFGDFVGVGQLDELEATIGNRRIDMLMIDIGGNDAGFSGVLTDLVSKDTIFGQSLRGAPRELLITALGMGNVNDALGREQVERRLAEKLADGGPISRDYDALNGRVEALRRSPGIGHVYITGYPVGLFDIRNADGTVGFRSCEIFEGPDMDVTGADAAMMKRMGRRLNALIREKAAAFGWTFIDVEREFEGHGYCARDESYWVQARTSCYNQGDWEGTMHPNTKGVQVWSRKYAAPMRTDMAADRAADPLLSR
jgi:hypothetical protein